VDREGFRPVLDTVLPGRARATPVARNRTGFSYQGAGVAADIQSERRPDEGFGFGTSTLAARALPGVVSRGRGAGCEDALVLSRGSEIGGSTEGAVFGTVHAGRGSEPCGSKGQIVDASLVKAPRQRSARQESAQVKVGRVPAGWSRKQHRHKDRDVRWTRKREENHHGNKNPVSVDREPGLVRRWQASDAACHDSRVFARVPDENSSSGDARADSTCHGRSHAVLLSGGGRHSRIPRKGYRNARCRHGPGRPAASTRRCGRRWSMCWSNPGPWAASWPGLSAWLGRTSRAP